MNDAHLSDTRNTTRFETPQQIINLVDRVSHFLTAKMRPQSISAQLHSSPQSHAALNCMHFGLLPIPISSPLFELSRAIRSENVIKTLEEQETRGKRAIQDVECEP